MKYLDVRLSQSRWMLHPMQEFIRDADAVRYEELLAWSGVAGDGDVEHELFYVEADRGRYEAALSAADLLQRAESRVMRRLVERHGRRRIDG